MIYYTKMSNKIMNFEQFIRVRETVMSMLIKRGFDPDNLNININEHTLKTQFNYATKEEQFMACNIFVKKSNKEDFNNTQALVHFILNPKSTYKTEENIINKEFNIYDIKSSDDVIIIIGHDVVDELNPFYEFDKKYDNIVVFHHKNLAFDITKHKLVPPHIKIKNNSEIEQIKKNLKIDSLYKLPVLLKTDAVSKFYHFRKGDLIKIIRPSIGNFKHEVYRIVI
jgi:DNA-directed RNA polymerase subunit H (RpoH/RPB5)